MSEPFKLCGKTLLLCACFLLFETSLTEAQETTIQPQAQVQTQSEPQRRGLLNRVFNRSGNNDSNKQTTGRSRWNPFRRNKGSEQPDVIKAPNESDVTVTSQGAPEMAPPVPPPTRYTNPGAAPQYVQQPAAPQPIPQHVTFQPIQKPPVQPAPQQPAPQPTYPQLFTQQTPAQPMRPATPTTPQLPRSRPQAIALPDNLLANAQPVALSAVLTPLPGTTPATRNVSQTRLIPAVPSLQDFPDPFPELSEKQADTSPAPVAPAQPPMQNLPIDLNSQQPVAEQKPVPVPEEPPSFQLVEPTRPSGLQIIGPIEQPMADVEIAPAPAVEPEAEPAAQPQPKPAETKPAAETRPEEKPAETKPAAEAKPAETPVEKTQPKLEARPEEKPAKQPESPRAELPAGKPEAKPAEPAAPETMPEPKSAAGQPSPVEAEEKLEPGPKSELDSAAVAKRRLIAERAGMKGLKGFCPVALRDSRDLKDTNIAFSANFEGRTYFFSSEEARKQFETNPTKYAPAEKGIDIIMTLKEHRDVEGSLDNAVWYQDRLYLFSHRDSLVAFVREPHKFLDTYASPEGETAEPEIVPNSTEPQEPKRLDATDEYEATQIQPVQPAPAETPATKPTEPMPTEPMPTEPGEPTQTEPTTAPEAPQPAETPRRSGLGSGLGSILGPTRTAEKPAEPEQRIETQPPVQPGPMPQTAPQPVQEPKPLEQPSATPKAPAQPAPAPSPLDLNPFEQPQVQEPPVQPPQEAQKPQEVQKPQAPVAAEQPAAKATPAKLPANPFQKEAVKPEPASEVKPAFEATPSTSENPFEDLSNPFETPEQ